MIELTPRIDRALRQYDRADRRARRLQSLVGGDSERPIDVMIKAAEAVLADALRVDIDARAEVAAELLASLDGPADPDAEAAWSVEIERRVVAIEAGTVKLEPWEDIRRRIEKEILGR